MKTAHFRYKCRQCGEIYTRLQMGLPNGAIDADKDLIAAILGIQRRGNRPGLLDLHACQNGCGVADLLGYVASEDSGNVVAPRGPITG